MIFEEAIEQGLEQGIEEGILRGKRETLLKLMSSKFGALPENIVAKIESLTSEAVLDTLLERILSTNSLEDMGLPGD